LFKRKLIILWKEHGSEALILGVGLFIAYLLYSSAEQPPHVMEGKAAPDFAIPLLDGGTLDTRLARDKGVLVLDFWTVACPYCREGFPFLVELQQEYSSQNVAVYPVNVMDDVERVQAYLARDDLHIPVAMDHIGEISLFYQVSSLPQLVIIDTDGRIDTIHVGRLLDRDKRDIRNRLKALLNEPSQSKV
jgi:peroxiredoxin